MKAFFALTIALFGAVAPFGAFAVPANAEAPMEQIAQRPQCYTKEYAGFIITGPVPPNNWIFDRRHLFDRPYYSGMIVSLINGGFYPPEIWKIIAESNARSQAVPRKVENFRVSPFKNGVGGSYKFSYSSISYTGGQAIHVVGIITPTFQLLVAGLGKTSNCIDINTR